MGRNEALCHWITANFSLEILFAASSQSQREWGGEKLVAHSVARVHPYFNLCGILLQSVSVWNLTPKAHKNYNSCSERPHSGSEI